MALLSRRFRAQSARPRIVIVGANFAGISAARVLAGTAAQVTLIDRAAQTQWLPNVHELVSRRKKPGQLQSDRRRLLQAMGHEFVCAEVHAIDRLQQRVITASGEWRDYDALILATGSEACRHNVPGVDRHALLPRSVDGALRLQHALSRLAALPQGRDVVIVGGGFEGLEILGEILRNYGAERRFQLRLVEQAPQLFPAYAGLHEHLQQQWRGEVSLHCGQRVRAVAADHVELDHGMRLPSRLTLWCAGRQSSALAAQAALDCAPDSGDALVQDSLQSRNDRHVFIAGDAAQLHMPLEKQAFYAQAMGAHAARNALRLLQGKALHSFHPLRKPALMSVGDRDAVLFYKQQAWASPALLPLKDALYHYGILQWQTPPRWRSPTLRQLGGDLRQSLSDLDFWQILKHRRQLQRFGKS